MDHSHRWEVRRWRRPLLLISVLLGTLLLSACSAATSGKAATGGALRWQSHSSDHYNPYFAFSTPVVANGVVYVASSDGSVCALNATTGAPLWRFQTDGAQGIAPSPVVTNGEVYLGSSKYLYALNA